MKYVEKEYIPPKQYFKDGVMSYAAAYVGLWLHGHLYQVVDGLREGAPTVFTGLPDF